jgi:hypothetical protein
VDGLAGGCGGWFHVGVPFRGVQIEKAQLWASPLFILIDIVSISDRVNPPSF